MSLPELFSLHGRTAIVTGASSGLGVQAARTLHAAGATVVVLARREDRLLELANELGERCLAVAGDLTRPEDVHRVLEVATGQEDPLQVLINVAGIADEQTALREGTDRFRSVLEVNLVGVFELSVAVDRKSVV